MTKKGQTQRSAPTVMNFGILTRGRDPLFLRDGQFWVTATVTVLLPAFIVMVAVRGVNLVTARTDTFALPVPDKDEAKKPPNPPPLANVSQLALLLISHFVLEVISISRVPPAFAKVSVFGDMVRVGAEALLS